MKTAALIFFVTGMIALMFADFVLPSEQRLRSNQELVWRLHKAVEDRSIEEAREAAAAAVLLDKQMHVSTGLARFGLRVGIGLLLASAASFGLYLKRKPSNLLQGGTQVRPVSSSDSPDPRG